MRVSLGLMSVLLCVLAVFTSTDAMAERRRARIFRRPIFSGFRQGPFRQGPSFRRGPVFSRPISRPQPIFASPQRFPSVAQGPFRDNSGGTFCSGSNGHAVSCNAPDSFRGGRPIDDDFRNRVPDRFPTEAQPTGPLSADNNRVARQAGPGSDPVTPDAVQPVPIPPTPVATTPIANEPLACTNPTEAICGGSNAAAVQAKEQQDAAARKTTVDRALASARLTGEQLIKSPPINFQGYRNYLSQLQAQVEVTSPTTVAAEVKRNLETAVSRNFPADSAAMIGKLRSVGVMAFSELATSRPEFLESFILACGPDGMSFNAVYFERGPNGTPVQAICPAYLAANTQRENLFRVMGHELGHSIDAVRFRGRFDNVMACFNLTPNLRQEASADFLMTQGVVASMQGSTPEAMLSFAQKAFGNYCTPGAGSTLSFPESLRTSIDNARANPVHPEREFRLSVIFGRDPGIRQLLGCRATTVAQGAPKLCSVNGQIN